MVKLFKCPECGEFLHSLTTFQSVILHHNLNIDKEENVYSNNEYSDPLTKLTYQCPKCKHTDDSRNVFITEIECDCEHENTSTEHTDNQIRIDICQHCGLVIDPVYVGDEC